MEEFMKRVLSEMEKPLLSAPNVLSYADADRNVTRESLRRFKESAAEDMAQRQMKKFSPLDKNKDEVLNLQEIAEHFHVEEPHILELYEIGKIYKETAIDQLMAVYEKIEKSHTAGQPGHQPSWILSDWILMFIEMDHDKDQKLTFKEIRTPLKEAFEKENREIMRKFESYLSLSADGVKTTPDQISEAAANLFRRFDRNSDKIISHNDYVRFYYATERRRQADARRECGIPSLKDEEAPTYAVVLFNSETKASLTFLRDTNGSRNFAHYAEIEIDKQTTPINLILSSSNEMVWNFKGDTAALNKVIVFGPASGFPRGIGNPRPEFLDHDRLYPPKLESTRQIYSGVMGVPPGKVVFSSSLNCWGPRIPWSKEPLPKQHQHRQEVLEDLRRFMEVKPYILEFRETATHIQVGSSPSIRFDTKKIQGTTNTPKGLDKKFWKKYLESEPQGYKVIDKDKTVLGAYAVLPKVYPEWAGIAQLVKDGTLEEIKIDPENKQAVFLLKKDLPEYFGVAYRNHMEFVFIKDNDNINIPQGSGYCVISRSGNILQGNSTCATSALTQLHKDKKIPAREKPVFLSLRKYLPVLPSYKESMEIRFDIDEPRCKAHYKNASDENCKTVPTDIFKTEIPPFAVSVTPEKRGTVKVKDSSVLIYTPGEGKFWDWGENYKLTLDLDSMSLPENVYINGKRKAQSAFYAAPLSAEISNMKIEPDDFDPENAVMTADIKANYEIRSFSNEAMFYIPEDANQPDDNTFSITDYHALPIEDPLDDLAFEMTGTEGKIKKIILPDPGGLKPTHYWLNDPRVEVSGSAPSMRNLIFDISQDEGKDFPADLKKLLSRAVQGDSAAQLRIGKVYLEGALLPRSLRKARKWLTKAAESGTLEAWVALGQYNLTAYPDDGAYNGDPEAHYWLSRAAEKNHPVALYELGTLYSKSFPGHYYDLSESVAWFKKSADLGYQPAMIRLGEIYEKGEGVKASNKTALGYYQKAAAEGNLIAQAHLARFHFFGLGVKENHKKAYDLAKSVLLKSRRGDLEIRDTAARVIADVLVEEFRIQDYKSQADHKKKTDAIVDKVFKDFPKDFLRIWIAGSMPAALDTLKQKTITNDSTAVRDILRRQELKTPDLPDLLLLKAKVLLNKGYIVKEKDFNRYHPDAITAAISFLEEVAQDKILEKEAVNTLAEIYLSADDPTSAMDLINHATYERDFTWNEIARAKGRLAEYTGNNTFAATNYEILNDIEGLVRVRGYEFGSLEDMEKILKDDIKKNPGQPRPLEIYASFLLHQKGDYQKAIQFGQQSLKLFDNVLIRHLVGMSYLIKASQLNKKEGFSENVRKHMNVARVLGVSKWVILDQCGMYCTDIRSLFEDYYQHQAEINEIKNIKTKPEVIEELPEDEKDEEGPI